MKKVRSHCFAVLLGAILGSSSFGFSADPAKAKKDPFTREAEKDAEPGKVESGVDNIVLDFQLMELPRKEVFKWEREGLNWSVWHDNVSKLIDVDEASVIVSTAKLARSGQRAQVASDLQFTYPTESDVLDIDPKGPLFPAAFEVKRLGLILMADPVLYQGGKILNLNYSLEWSEYAGENLETRPLSDRIQDTDVISPQFAVKKISNSVELEIGVYRMLTQFESETEGNVVLVFARFDLVTAAPLKDRAKMANVGGIQLRSSWVDVSADLWHDWLLSGSLRTLFGGGAWDNVSNEIGKGSREVQILASPTLSCPSGQRGKAEVVTETVTNFRDFEPPQVVGGVSQSKGTETESIGLTLDVDPVLGVNGIVDLTFAASSTSLCGNTVSYRREEAGKWVPSVSHLKIFEDRITTQVALDEEMNLLTAVMTPSNKDGTLDYSKKRLFFIHNETFTAP